MMVMILGMLCLGDLQDAYIVTHYGKSWCGKQLHLITRYSVQDGRVDVLLTHTITWFIGHINGGGAANNRVCLQYCTK